MKGKPYPVLKFDAYLGQITEEHGLIEPTPSVRPGVQVYAYGVYYLGYRFCAPLVDRVSRRYGADVRVMTAVVLMVHDQFRQLWAGRY